MLKSVELSFVDHCCGGGMGSVGCASNRTARFESYESFQGLCLRNSCVKSILDKEGTRHASLDAENETCCQKSRQLIGERKVCERLRVRIAK